MTPTLAQAYALRAQMDAFICLLESVEGMAQPQLEPGSCPNCGAGEDKQIDRSTLDGTKRKRCSACGVDWTP